MTTTKNNEHKKLNFSSEREQSQTCLNSAEHEKNQGRKVLNVPNLRFPEFQGEWEKQKLCDISSIVGRIGFRGYTTNDIVEKGMGAIALSPTNIVNNQLTYDKDNTYISMPKYDESPEIMIKQGDVIFVKTGSTVGKVAYVDKLICKTTLNPQVVVLKDIKCDNYILSVIMSTRKFQNKIQRITVGGAVPTLSQVAMGNIFISLPTAKEQEKISKFISLIDKRIATQNKIIDKLQSLIKGLNDSLYAQYGGKVLTSFAELGTSYSGLSGKSAQDFGSGKPFITYLNVYSNNAINENDFQYVAIKDGEKQNIVEYGDVLFTLSSETPEEVGIGSVYLGKEKVYLNSFCFGIHITNTEVAFPPYLSYYVSSTAFRKFIYPYAQGSTRFNLCKADFEKASIKLPTLENQKRIYSILSHIDSKIETERQILDLYNSQKQYLLRQVFI